MTHFKTPRALTAISLVLSLAAPAAIAQTSSTYHAPKNGWGQPDLQGTYTTATITPLTRDPKYGERNALKMALRAAMVSIWPKPGGLVQPSSP